MKNYLYKSVILHIVAILLFTINLSFLKPRVTTIAQVPIIVDLKDINISEMTNLPPKAKIDKETKDSSTVSKKEPSSKPSDKTKDNSKPIDDKKEEKSTSIEEPKEPKQDFLVAPESLKKKDKDKEIPKKTRISPPKPSKKPSPPKEAAKTEDSGKVTKDNKKEPELATSLKNLLASVDEISKNIGEKNQEATVAEGTEVSHMGVEGGTQGSYFSELSISEIDAIAGRLRACWNIDPGAKGAQNMIVEVRAYLNSDGSLKEARVVDTGRYNSDTYFRSIADSAVRAVHICSPYNIFADKYADKYDSWKTMLLKFNPLDGNVK